MYCSLSLLMQTISSVTLQLLTLHCRHVVFIPFSNSLQSWNLSFFDRSTRSSICVIIISRFLLSMVMVIHKVELSEVSLVVLCYCGYFQNVKPPVPTLLLSIPFIWTLREFLILCMGSFVITQCSWKKKALGAWSYNPIHEQVWPYA